MEQNVILGAGLTGLSSSFHIGHTKCLILEKNNYAFGHVHSEIIDGFTWDQGPHVSFTMDSYVRSLFAESVSGEFCEYPVKTANYYQGHWIDHPAQSNLYQVPEPLRHACLNSFLETRMTLQPQAIPHYQAWLDYAFGPVFREHFPEVYTRKYWTLPTKDLGIDWIGKRVFYPRVEDVLGGVQGPLDRPTHYISHVRYPKSGGYQAFCEKLREGARIQFNSNILEIRLKEKRVSFKKESGRIDWVEYGRLINTLPLPIFCELCVDLSNEVKEAARSLKCTSALLVNVTAPHSTLKDGNWFYVYDEDKISTRIHYAERLSRLNVPDGCTGIQVEVYYGKWKPLSSSRSDIVRLIVEELIEMGFLNPMLCRHGINDIKTHVIDVPWANVVFDHQRRQLLDLIYTELEAFGLDRTSDDLDAFVDWSSERVFPKGSLFLGGRFGQWNYFWSDDCVLRGQVAGNGKVARLVCS